MTPRSPDRQAEQHDLHPTYSAGASTPSPQSRDDALGHARAVIELLFGPVAQRTFDVRYWDGSVEHGQAATTAFRLGINRRGALRRMLLPPSELSLVEAYLSGDVDIDGELEAAMGLSDEIGVRLRSPRRLARIARHLLALPRTDATLDDVRALRSDGVVAAVGRRHEPTRDRAAIRYHYDVGNEFYALWLDERMVYSCAYYERDTDTLEEAQEAKLDLICRKLRLRPGHRLLDVGCGWGALILHAARHYGVTALGITLSDAQAALARERIAAAGLEDRCRVEIRDYRALPADLRFDRISSVGMVEHVGADHLAAYFAALHRALVPGGLLLNHGIVSVNAARPGGSSAGSSTASGSATHSSTSTSSPTASSPRFIEVVAAAEGEGFETRDVESLREHYALTLRDWVARLLRHEAQAIALTSERIFRIWRLYMTASAYGFTHGRINVVQTLLARPDAEGRVELPMTRADILR